MSVCVPASSAAPGGMTRADPSAGSGDMEGRLGGGYGVVSSPFQSVERRLRGWVVTRLCRGS